MSFQRANIYRLDDGRYQASVTYDGVGWAIGIAPDPLDALQEAQRLNTEGQLLASTSPASDLPKKLSSFFE